MADALTGIAEHCRREGSKEAPIDCLPAEAEHQSALTQLAVERTWLYRGVSETGPTPPYEAEWCTGTSTSTVLLSLTKSYRASGLALALGERADYLGIELGYYQRLILQQAACEAEDDEAGRGNSGGGESTGGRPRRDSAGGSGVRTLQQRFHSEHLGRWVAPYVKATLPLAQSDFFRGHLLLVQGCVARELIQEPAREPT
jgi:TorA maturation chaperone TorD